MIASWQDYFGLNKVSLEFLVGPILKVGEGF